MYLQSILLGIGVVALSVGGRVMGQGASNLVVNGTFEASGGTFGEHDAPGVWVRRIHDAPNARIEGVQGLGREGSVCVRYMRDSGKSRNIHLDQQVAVEPNTVYEVTAWVRGDGKLRPVIVVQTMGWKTLAVSVAEASNDWQKVCLVFHSYDNRNVRLEWFPGATGKLYTGVPGTSFLDDVAIRPVDVLSGNLKRAFGLTRPRVEDEVDLSSLSRGKPGVPLPLRPIHCRDGVLRYEDGAEVALWGVNFQTALSWEWNGRLERVGVPLDVTSMKQVTDENLSQLNALDLNVVRLHLLPADFSGADGMLQDSIFLDALDYLISRCAQEGIYVYLTLINEMKTAHVKDSFIVGIERERWLFEEAFIASAERYATALMSHKNRYSGIVYAHDPAIAVVEIMNEPRYPDFADLEKFAAIREIFDEWRRTQGITQYLDRYFAAFRYDMVTAFLRRMRAAIEASGSTKPIVWNLNWPRMINTREEIFQAVADSSVDGVSFCLYPGQSDVKNPFWANPADLSDRNYFDYLRTCYTDYSYLRWILGKRFSKKAKLVYEFESMYNHTSYLYPAMAALFRSLGVQIAPMWQYTLSPVAEFMGGSHYLNLLCTPSKAVSFRIAKDVFVSTPRFAPYDADAETVMGNDQWRSSFDTKNSVFSSDTVFMNTGDAAWSGLEPHISVTAIMGCGNSELVSYDGTGSYTVTIQQNEILVEIRPDVTYHRPTWQRERLRKGMPCLCSLESGIPHHFTLRVSGVGGRTTVFRRDTSEEIPAIIKPGEIGFEAIPGNYVIRGVEP